MFRKLNLLLVAVLALALCGLVACDTEGEAKQEEVNPAAQMVTLAEFEANSANYEGKLVKMTGTVSHVCRHGGKKMFIFGEDPQNTFRIEANVDVGSFAVELEGSEVEVEGTVQVMKMDAAYLDEWEEEIKAELAAAETAAAEGNDSAKAHCAAEAQDMAPGVENNPFSQVEALRADLAASEVGYLAFYHLDCAKFEELKPAEEPESH